MADLREVMKVGNFHACAPQQKHVCPPPLPSAAEWETGGVYMRFFGSAPPGAKNSLLPLGGVTANPRLPSEKPNGIYVFFR